MILLFPLPLLFLDVAINVPLDDPSMFSCVFILKGFGSFITRVYAYMYTYMCFMVLVII